VSRNPGGRPSKSSPLPPPWPWSPSSAGAGPSRPLPSPPGSGCRPCIAGLRWAAGAILGSLPWWGPWLSPRPPGKPSWPIIGSGQAPGHPCSPASVGSENRFPFFNGKKTGKRGSIVSKPGIPPADRFENRLTCKQWIEQRKPLPKYSRNRGSSRPHRFENWLYLINRWKTGNEQGRSSRNRGGGRHGTIGAPSPGGSGVRTARETLEGGAGGRVPG
jgi:hypothetical protein